VAHCPRRIQAPPEERHAGRQLAVATTLAIKLGKLDSIVDFTHAAADELQSAFGYYLTAVHEVSGEALRLLATAGELAVSHPEYLRERALLSFSTGNRVAHSGQQLLINDTHLDPEYVAIRPPLDPRAELCTPIFVHQRVWGVLSIWQRQANAFGGYDVMLANAVAAQLGAAVDRHMLTVTMESNFTNILGLLSDILEYKDAYTGDHAHKVATLAARVAATLELDADTVRRVRYCALLHDIGKIAVPSEVMNKPGRLTAEETTLMRKHASLGATLLARSPLLADIAPLVRATHERWDGQGYPDGVSGTAIPIESRVVAICDAWHAMIEDRVYRKALGEQQAIAELTDNAGSQFDPKVVEALLKTVGAQDDASPAAGGPGA
jgi:putative nucleotidyltransferase with HDIG domain